MLDENPEERWEYNDPQLYIDNDRINKERLNMLGIKLQKFVAERNVSFNLKMVFREWHECTEEKRKKNEGRISIISSLRKFIRDRLD